MLWSLLSSLLLLRSLSLLGGFRRSTAPYRGRDRVQALHEKIDVKFQHQEEKYNYSDKDGTYDVPFIQEQRWYRLNVRKASEKKLQDYFQQQALLTDSIWRDIVIDTYYPSKSYIAFEGTDLKIKSKAMIPGLLYIKTSRMDIDVADDLEQVKNIYILTKTSKGLIVPLGEEEARQLEIMRNNSSTRLSSDAQMIKKNAYVSIIRGEHAGKYGIVIGAKGGKLEVCLRSEYRDDWDVFNINDIKYLHSPPEKNWQTLTAKEAVENLMAKNPKSPTIKSLREQGLLEEILHPGRKNQNRYKERSDSGSKAISSLSKIGEKKQKNIDFDLKTLLKSKDDDEYIEPNEQVDTFISDLFVGIEDGTDAMIGEGIELNISRNLDKETNASARKSPRMEEYASFEGYLDALVSHDQNESLGNMAKAGFVNRNSDLVKSDSGAVDTNLTNTEYLSDKLDSFFETLEDL